MRLYKRFEVLIKKDVYGVVLVVDAKNNVRKGLD